MGGLVGFGGPTLPAQFEGGGIARRRRGLVLNTAHPMRRETARASCDVLDWSGGQSGQGASRWGSSWM